MVYKRVQLNGLVAMGFPPLLGLFDDPKTLHFAGFTLAVWMVIADSAQAEYCTTFPSPCAEIDKKIVPVTGARQFMSNN